VCYVYSVSSVCRRTRRCRRSRALTASRVDDVLYARSRLQSVTTAFHCDVSFVVLEYSPSAHHNSPPLTTGAPPHSRRLATPPGRGLTPPLSTAVRRSATARTQLRVNKNWQLVSVATDCRRVDVVCDAANRLAADDTTNKSHLMYSTPRASYHFIK